MKQRTFAMIKPDALQRRLVGEVVGRIEKKGLKIVALKLIKVQKLQAEKLYEIHKKKPFYSSLVNFVTSGPVLVMVIEGHSAVSVMRKLAGATFGYDAEPGTIRGDLSISRGKNVIHCTDSPESAARELSIFFKASELLSYDIQDEDWTCEADEK